MADEFGAVPTVLDSPVRHAVDVTPSDSTDLDFVARALYIGVSGDVKVTTVAGDDVTFKNAVAGSYLPVCAKRVWDTGTVATYIIAMW